MSKKQEAVLKEVNSSGGTYVCLCTKQRSVDIGYVKSERALKSHIAAFAAKYNVTTVEVLTGHNIMDCGWGPSAKFSVSVSVK